MKSVEQKRLALARRKLYIEGIIANAGEEISVCILMCFNGDETAFDEWVRSFVNGSVCHQCED